MAELAVNTEEENNQISTIPEQIKESQQTLKTGVLGLDQSPYSGLDQFKRAEEDVKKQQTPIAVPTLSDLLNSTEPITSFENLPKNVTQKDVNLARYFVNANKNNIEIPKENKSAFVQAYANLSRNLNDAQSQANIASDKPFAIAFTEYNNDPERLQLRPEYDNNVFNDLLRDFDLLRDDKAFAENRIRLTQFMNRMTSVNQQGEAVGFLVDKPEAAKILQKHFGTGNFFQSIRREMADIGGGLNQIGSSLLRYNRDLIKSLTKYTMGETDSPLQFLRQNAGERTAEYKKWMDNSPSWVADAQERLNRFIIEKYNQENGEGAYDKLPASEKYKLSVDPEHAFQLFGFAFNDQNFLYQIGSYGATNWGTNIIATYLSRTAKLPFRAMKLNESPVQFFRRMEKEKFQAGSVYQDMEDFIQLKYGNSPTSKINPFKYFNTQRLKLKGEIGFFSNLNQEKRINPAIVEARNKARIKYAETQKTGNKLQISAAERILERAENKYTMAMVANNKIDPNQLLIVPNQYLAKLGYDEAYPSVIQGLVHSFMESDDPNQIANTQVVSSLAYLGAAVGATQWITNKVGNLANRLDIVHDVNFMTKDMIDTMTTKFTLGGLTIPKLLDQDLRTLKISDGPGLPKRDITPDEYKSFASMKQIFSRLSPESQVQAEKNRVRMNQEIESIKAIFPDTTETQELIESLQLSFAETSNILAFQALGLKIQTHLNTRDIIKVSDRFLESVANGNRANNRLFAHSTILQEIQAQFTKTNRALTPEQRQKYTDVIRLIKNINTGLTKQVEDLRIDNKATLRALKASFFRDKDVINLGSEEEIANAASNFFEAQKLLGTFDLKPTLSFEEMSRRTAQEITTLKNAAADMLSNVDKTMKTYKLRVATGEGIRQTAKNYFAIVNEYNTTRGNILYNPLNEYPEIEMSTIYNQLIDINKGSSFENGVTFDNLLRSFIPDGAFSQSAAGKEFVTLLNKNAENALLKTYMKLIPENLMPDDRQAKAAAKLQNFKDQASGLVRTAFDIDDADNVGAVHYYEYLKSNPILPDGSTIDVAEVTFPVLDADVLYRNLREKGRELVAIGEKSNDSLKVSNGQKYLNIARNLNKALESSEGGKELQYSRLEWRVDVGKSKGKGTLLGQFNHYKHNDDAIDKKDILLRKAVGLNFLDAIGKDVAPYLKSQSIKDYQQGIIDTFGEVRIPKEYADPNDPTRINRNIELTPEVIKDIEENSIKVLDNTTEKGKAGLAMVDAAVLQLFRESRVFQKKIKDVSGVRVIEFEGIKKVGEAGTINSSFTSSDGQGLFNFKEMQEALTFTLEDGTKHVVNLDIIHKQETDLRTLFDENNSLAVQYNDAATKINNAIDSKGDALEAKLRTDAAETRNRHYRILDYDPSKGGLLNSYVKDLPETIDDVDADINRFTLFKEDLDFVIDHMKNNPNIKATPEEAKRYFAGMLIQEIQEAGGITKVPVTDTRGNAVTANVMQNPIEAFALLEKPTTRAIFKELGVTDAQYEAMLAVTGHSVTLRYMYDNSGNLMKAPNISLPETGYTDTGIISRAFNYARGLVSKEYLLVEAGFRMMRDNDLNMLDFILNDPSAANMLTTILQEKANPNEIAFVASTLPQRMFAYITRQLSFQENARVALYEPYVETDFQEEGENENENIQ